MQNPDRTSNLVQTWRDRAGFCGVDALDQPVGTLDLSQQQELAAMALRTKLTHDLLAGFADRYAAFPEQLVGAQTHELLVIRELLKRYRLSDPITALTAGAFADAETRHDYERLLAQGSAGRAAALEVIARVARETIAMLDAALPRLTAPDVRNTYLNLYATTTRQLRLVQAWRSR